MRLQFGYTSHWWEKAGLASFYTVSLGRSFLVFPDHRAPVGFQATAITPGTSLPIIFRIPTQSPCSRLRRTRRSTANHFSLSPFLFSPFLSIFSFSSRFVSCLVHLGTRLGFREKRNPMGLIVSLEPEAGIIRIASAVQMLAFLPCFS